MFGVANPSALSRSTGPATLLSDVAENEVLLMRDAKLSKLYASAGP
jgi:hypothetical protein